MKDSNLKRFIAGFNVGYLMARYCPHVVNRLTAGIQQTFDFLEGIEAGKQEYEQELEQEKLDEIAHIRNSSQDLNRDDIER